MTMRMLSADPGRFYGAAKGDEVTVMHGVLVDEDDPIWLPVREHVRQRQMVLLARVEGDHPAFNMNRAVVWCFGTPERQARMTPADIEAIRSEAFKA